MKTLKVLEISKNKCRLFAACLFMKAIEADLSLVFCDKFKSRKVKRQQVSRAIANAEQQRHPVHYKR